MKQIADYADILMIAPFYLGYLWMADKFCKKYLETSKRNELLFVISYFCGWLLMEIVNRCYHVPYIFHVLLSHIFFMGLVLLLFQADVEKKILAASLLMLITILVKNFCGSFLSCLFLLFLHTVKKIPEPFLGGKVDYLISCASLLVVISAIYWMSKHLMSVFYGKTGKWYVTLSIPLLMFIAVLDVAGWGASNGIMVRSGGNMGVYYDQVFSHAEFLVLTALSMFAIGFYVFGMERIYLEQKKSSQYHLQIAIYKMLEEHYSQSERLRHDMKNHIIALSGLFRNGEWEKMGSYLKNMEDNALEIGGDITGNKAVDALLYNKRKWAKREHVNWECDVKIPAVCGIPEFDLCVLFGNLLDNALEACERLQGNEIRFVNIKAEAIKKCFLLEVQNSMNRTEKYVEGFTNKGNPQEHGIGLTNVKDVVRKYNGVVNIETKDAVFVITILVPLSNSVHDIKRAD